MAKTFASDHVWTPATGRDVRDAASGEGLSWLISFLKSRPSLDEVAKAIIMDVLVPYRAQYVSLTHLRKDGIMLRVGVFGDAAQMRHTGATLSIWDPSPSARAARDIRPIVLPTARGAAQAFSVITEQNFEPCPIISFPLISLSGVLGSLTVFFDGDMIETGEVEATLATIADLLVVYLQDAATTAKHKDTQALPISHNVMGRFEQEKTRVADVQVPGRDTMSVLSPRQLLILSLIDQGLTNERIADRIGYSLSTVRQEAMKVFRFLDVGTRQDAVVAARLCGLIS